MTSVTLRTLTKRFGAVVAVDNLNLEIQEGELITLLGPSGCGKTTTLRLISGFDTPDEGSIIFGRQEVNRLPPEQRNVGLVFQNYALFPHMTVFQNVAFGLEMRGEGRETVRDRVAAILDQVQLGSLAKRYPHQLSGGQQQRVALARALVINPALFLLDEPLANLDAKLREEMRFYIRRLQREFRITTVYVTHDQAEAMVLADRIVVLRDGRLQQVGLPEEIYRRPATGWVADFIGLSNFISGRVARRDGPYLTVETSIGVIRVSGTPQNGDIAICVRPEAIHFGPTHHNRLRGTVSGRSFLGNLLDYRIECEGGLSLRVQADPSHDYNRGQAVDLSFSPDDAWAVDAQGQVRA